MINRCTRTRALALLAFVLAPISATTSLALDTPAVQVHLTPTALLIQVGTVPQLVSMTVRVMNPESELVVNVESRGEPVIWSPSTGAMDGHYRYEVFVLSQNPEGVQARPGREESEFTSERATGMFEVQGGQIVPPEPRSQGEISRLRSWLTGVGGQVLTRIMSVLISPAYAADVTVSSTFPIINFDDTDVAGIEWRLGGNSGGWGLIDLVNNNLVVEVFSSNNNTDSLVIDANGDLHLANDRVFIERSIGRVGIGTTTPTADLDIRTTRGNIWLTDTDDPDANGVVHRWEINANDDSLSFTDITGSGDHDIVFFFANAPSRSFVIAPNGNIGLKTLSPQGNLHIFGEANKDVFNGIGPDPTANGTALNFGYSGNSFGLGSGFFNVRPAPGAVAPNPSLRFATANQQRLIITNLGRVGIGTLNPSQALEVQGNIRANGSFLSNGTTLNVPDSVFEPNYQLRPLPELQAYITREKHLPDIPSAQEIREQGVNLSALQMQLLKKVEELTLYAIEQAQENHALRAENAQLQERVAAIEAVVKELRQQR